MSRIVGCAMCVAAILVGAVSAASANTMAYDMSLLPEPSVLVLLGAGSVAVLARKHPKR